MLQLRTSRHIWRVNVLNTDFYLRPTSISPRIALLKAFAELEPGQHERLIDCLAPFIESIAGHQGLPGDILRDLADPTDLKRIAEMIIRTAATELVEHVGKVADSLSRPGGKNEA